MTSLPPPPSQPPPPPPWSAPPPPAPLHGPSVMSGPLRGRVPLRLALVLGVVGVVLVSIGAVLLARDSFGKVDDFDRVRLSDRVQTVTFDRTGDYVAYFEIPADGSHRADVRLALATPDGDPVRVEVYGRNTNLTYTSGGRFGQAAFTFSIPDAGTYEVQARSADAPPGAGMAFGESIAGSLVAGLVTVLPGIVLVIAAIVLLVVGLVRRGAHKREREKFLRANHGP